MDPFTALGLASNIVQFVDFASKLISGAVEVYSSTTGTTAETTHLSTVIEDLEVVASRLSPYSRKPRTDDEIALSDLVSKCRKLSGDLLKVLNKLKSKNPHSKWESLRVTWASMREKEQVASIEKRVNNYRREIILRINIMMSEEQSSIQAQLKNIEQQNYSCATQTRDELAAMKKEILQAVEQLRKSYQQSNTQTSPGYPIESLKDICATLSSMAEVTTRISKEDRILRELRFDSMTLREASIENAHTETFKWLLHDPSLDSKSTHETKLMHVSESAHESGPANNPGPSVESKAAHDSDPQRRDIEEENKVKESEMRQNARASFLEWLRLGTGIFYISGKAGSGKSTLMKFLSQHRRTRAELSHWAADKKLVFAHFFFWNSGTELQKSLEGLYRSVLFETLRECPELIQDLFPGRWKAAHDAREHGSPIEFQDILAAFEVLTTTKNRSFPGHKFCFFIDGLDEYAGDHWKMAKNLTTWAASPDVKICVSSRPHNEFEDSFSPDPKLRLRLHELTKVDMERFVNDEFNGDARFVRVKDKDDRYLKLVNEIVERADGVFL